MGKRAAIILAGGRSERFQNTQEAWQDKALVELFGKPLLVHTVENVREVVEEVAVSVNDEKRKRLYLEVLARHGVEDVKLLVDTPSNGLGGPLVGILTGLKAVKADYCFTLPSDMPLIQPKVVKFMFDSAKDVRVVVPIWPNGRLETLTMVLKRREALEISQTLCQLKRLRSDDIIRGALNVLLISTVGEIRRLDPELKSFVNINSPQDLSQLQPRQAHGQATESLRLNLGNLPMPELRRIRSSTEKFNDGRFPEAAKAFSSSATRLEADSSYFWAAINRENEGKSLLNQSKQEGITKLAVKQEVKGQAALLKAANDYGLETEVYEKDHAVFLAERARSNKQWCESLANEATRG